MKKLLSLAVLILFITSLVASIVEGNVLFKSGSLSSIVGKEKKQ